MGKDSRFEAAAAHVKHLPSTPANGDLLRLYALYKQATKGDCTGDRPGAFSVTARAKWDAWHDIAGTAKGEAQEQYVAIVRELDPAWIPPPSEEQTHGGETDFDANDSATYDDDEKIISSPRKRHQSSMGFSTPTIVTAASAGAGSLSSHQRGATWSPNMAAPATAQTTPLTPTFVRSMKNNDHTAYVISVSYRQSSNTLVAEAAPSETPSRPSAAVSGPPSKQPAVQSTVSDDVPESAEAYFNNGEGSGKNDDVVWNVTARYSDFVRLHKALIDRGGFREDDLPSLPPKKWLFNQEPDFVQKRMDELQQYTSLLLLDPRIARNEIVTSFFKVAEHLMMLRATRNKPQHDVDRDSTPLVRTLSSPTTSPITGRESDRSGDSTGSNKISHADESKVAAAVPSSELPHSTSPPVESVSESDHIVPQELVALDADNNVLHASQIKSWKRESFLTLPWMHRNSNLELRFQGGLYASFTATDKTSRGERILQLSRRGDASSGANAQEIESTDAMRKPGQITLRVRLRTNRVKGGLSASPLSSLQDSPNHKPKKDGGRRGDNDEKSLLQQVLLLSMGFLVASVLSWLAFRYEAPLATTMSLPLLPIALVLGWVFGDSPKRLADVSYKERKSSEMFLNVGIQIMSHAPAEDQDDEFGGASSQTEGGAQSKNLPRFIDMTGEWTVDYNLSKTTIEPMTKALGVGWVARKAINALTFTTVIKHTPDHFDRFDKLKGNRVGKEQPAYKLDGEPRKVEDENGFVDVRCWSEPSEAMVTVETTIPETPKNIGALLTDTLTLEHNGEWLHQRIKVETKGSSDPVFVDRILKRVEGKPIEGPGLWG